MKALIFTALDINCELSILIVVGSNAAPSLTPAPQGYKWTMGAFVQRLNDISG